MLFLLFALFLKHFIADFVLQTKYQWSNKGTFLHPGGLLHSGIHALLTIVVLMIFDVCYIELVLLDFFSHYIIDYSKVNINRILKYTPDSYGFWVMTGLDQFLHYLTYLYISYIIYLLN